MESSGNPEFRNARRPTETEKGEREPKAATRSPMGQARRKAAGLNLRVLDLATPTAPVTATGSARGRMWPEDRAMDKPSQERRNEARRRRRADGAYESAMVEAAPVVHIGENSPEQIAYKLLLLIASKEGKLLDDLAIENRKWLLDTYAECLLAVRKPATRK